jgi:hypothetical protein
MVANYQRSSATERIEGSMMRSLVRGSIRNLTIRFPDFRLKAVA